MSIIIACKCGKKYKAKSESAGKKARCKVCGAVIVIPDAPKAPSFNEKDNRGTRHDSLDMANSYWMLRSFSPTKAPEPYVMYTFDREEAARNALLALPCIHLAEDSGKLICTEVLNFGYYKTEQGKYEALVCGDDLSHQLWEQARKSFASHGGALKNKLEPKGGIPVPRTKEQQFVDYVAAKIRPAPAPKAKAAPPGKVEFVREARQQKLGRTMVYRIHKGPDAASAQAFLEKNPVTQQFLYIIVETPEGNYCRDIQGMYKE